MPAWLVPLALVAMVGVWIASAILNRRILHWTVAGLGGALAISQALHLWP